VPALPFEYAVVRVVPLVEREEFVNAGLLLFCEGSGLLTVRLELDEARLLALAPDVDLDLVRTHLATLAPICRGGPEGGPIGLLPVRERWRWLVAPRSTILQTSAPHGGLAEDPDAVAERVMDRVVRRRRAPRDT